MEQNQGDIPEAAVTRGADIPGEVTPDTATVMTGPPINQAAESGCRG